MKPEQNEELEDLAGDVLESELAEADDSGDNLDAAAADASAGTEPTQAEIDAEVLAEIAGEEKPKMVPHSRFNEVNETLKAERAARLLLEEELARSRGASTKDEPAKPKAEPEAFDYEAAEDQYAAALLDGDRTLAKQIRASIRQQEKKDYVAQAEQAADARYSQNRQQDEQKRAKTESEAALAKAYTAFPFLDSGNESANEEAIEEALALTNHYVGKGMSIGEALTAATEKVGPRYAPAGKDTPAAKPAADIAKNLERESRIPPAAAGLGARATQLDVSRMTEADIRKLSPEDEATLAGDVLS